MKLFHSIVLFLGIFLGVNLLATAENPAKIKPKHVRHTTNTKSAFPQNKVIIKVINQNGDLVMETEVAVSQFLDKAQNIAALPEGSMFLVFYGNTAYYLVQNPQSTVQTQ